MTFRLLVSFSDRWYRARARRRTMAAMKDGRHTDSRRAAAIPALRETQAATAGARCMSLRPTKFAPPVGLISCRAHIASASRAYSD